MCSKPMVDPLWYWLMAMECRRFIFRPIFFLLRTAFLEYSSRSGARFFLKELIPADFFCSVAISTLKSLIFRLRGGGGGASDPGFILGKN